MSAGLRAAPPADATREAILGALWPGDVWAVMDSARHPRVWQSLMDSRLEFRCLYSGRLPQALERAAPQLVQLPPAHRLVQRWIDEGWGAAWGVFLRVRDPANLRHHLRKFLRVQDESGRRLLFRFYDPRVLPAFLDSSDADMLRTFFGPDIEAWLVESDAGATLAEYRLQAGRLQRRRIGVAA